MSDKQVAQHHDNEVSDEGRETDETLTCNVEGGLNLAEQSGRALEMEKTMYTQKQEIPDMFERERVNQDSWKRGLYREEAKLEEYTHRGFVFLSP